MRNSILLIGLMRSPAQLQQVVTVELSTHGHFPTAALGEGIVQPAEPVPAEERPERTDLAGDKGSDQDAPGPVPG